MRETQLWALAMLANMISWGLAPLILIGLRHTFPKALNSIRYPPRGLRNYLLPSAFFIHSTATIILMTLTGGWVGALLGVSGITLVAFSLWHSLHRYSPPTPTDQIVILIGFLLLSPIVIKLVFLVEP